MIIVELDALYEIQIARKYNHECFLVKHIRFQINHRCFHELVLETSDVSSNLKVKKKKKEIQKEEEHNVRY